MSRSAERYRKLEQAAEQVLCLEAERAALAEVLGRMCVDARSLEARAASAERECAALQSRLESEVGRDRQIAHEVSELEQKAAATRLQIAAAARRLDTLNQETALLERALLDKQSEMSAAQAFLGGAVERVSRLDYKLRFAAYASSLGRR